MCAFIVYALKNKNPEELGALISHVGLGLDQLKEGKHQNENAYEPS